jgi:hypothetical protein
LVGHNAPTTNHAPTPADEKYATITCATRRIDDNSAPIDQMAGTLTNSLKLIDLEAEFLDFLIPSPDLAPQLPVH